MEMLKVGGVISSCCSGAAGGYNNMDDFCTFFGCQLELESFSKTECGNKVQTVLMDTLKPKSQYYPNDRQFSS